MQNWVVQNRRNRNLAGCAMVLAALALASCKAKAEGETPGKAESMAVNAALCDSPVALQVLGSGGPIADDNRAGTSYLLRRNGAPLVLIDAGSGAFLRFAEAKARITPLKAIALSHYHGDHVSDLAAILNSGNFEKRSAPLPIIGPAAGGVYPGLTDHLSSLFAPEGGAFPYLSGYLSGAGDAPKLQITEVDTRSPGLATVFEDDGVKIEAIPVHHLDVPALGYRVTLDGAVILFAGDQSFLSEDFEAALAGSKPDVMVIHNAIPEGPGQPRGLHRSPSSWGELAAKVQPAHVVISHNMQRAIHAGNQVVDELRRQSEAEPVMASDLSCFAVTTKALQP